MSTRSPRIVVHPPRCFLDSESRRWDNLRAACYDTFIHVVLIPLFHEHRVFYQYLDDDRDRAGVGDDDDDEADEPVRRQSHSWTVRVLVAWELCRLVTLLMAHLGFALLGLCLPSWPSILVWCTVVVLTVTPTTEQCWVAVLAVATKMTAMLLYRWLFRRDLVNRSVAVAVRRAFLAGDCVFIKFGQMLSSALSTLARKAAPGSLLNCVYVELTQLCTQVPVMSDYDLNQVLQRNVHHVHRHHDIAADVVVVEAQGGDLDLVMEWGIGGSVAQTHRCSASWSSCTQSLDQGTDQHGRRGTVPPCVAVKLQRNNLLFTALVSVRIVGYLVRALHRIPALEPLGLQQRFDDFVVTVMGQLDFDRERRDQLYFVDKTRSWRHVKVPEVLTELSTPEMIVMEWIEHGLPLHQVPRSVLDDLALEPGLIDEVCKFFLLGIYDDSFDRYNADAHVGNILVDTVRRRFYFIDFGFVGRMDPKAKAVQRQFIKLLCQDRCDEAGEWMLRHLFNAPFAPPRHHSVTEHALSEADQVKAVEASAFLSRALQRHLRGDNMNYAAFVAEVAPYMDALQVKHNATFAVLEMALVNMEGSLKVAFPGVNIWTYINKAAREIGWLSDRDLAQLPEAEQARITAQARNLDLFDALLCEEEES